MGAQGFDACFGRPPEVSWVAPGRVNVIGEHTDYNDGFALPVALPLVVTAWLAARNDDQLHVASAQHGGDVAVIADVRPGTVDGWASYVAGAVWALREAGHHVPGLDVYVDGTVPPGAGLSSSAALECAVAAGIDDLLHLGIRRPDLARIAHRGENEFVGAPTGIMDQAASLLCTDRHALLLDARSLHTTAVPFDLAGHALAMMVVDTRTPHRLVDSEYAARRRECEAAARALGVPALRDLDVDALGGEAVTALDPVQRRRVRHIVSENARVLDTVAILTGDADVRAIGPLLTDSHTSLRDDFEVSCDQLDTAVDALLGAGAYGARMTGGGFGGCAIALVDAGREESMLDAVRRAFTDHGFTAPALVPGGPAPGAHRLG